MCHQVTLFEERESLLSSIYKNKSAGERDQRREDHRRFLHKNVAYARLFCQFYLQYVLRLVNYY
jgi:hypothetical protein